MICNKCLGETEREAVALQKVILSEYKTGGIKRDFAYIPVCEEHKSDSTEVEMVIPLPGLIDLPLCAAYKRITELELGLELEQLQNQKCNCPICWAKRNGEEPPMPGECSAVKRRLIRGKTILEQLANLSAGEFQCHCPECIDMRANHGQTRLQLREEITLLHKRLRESRESLEASETIREELDIEITHLRSNRSRELSDVLDFIRLYFTRHRLPGCEKRAFVDMVSDEYLIDLIGLAHGVELANNKLQDFLDTRELDT